MAGTIPFEEPPEPGPAGARRGDRAGPAGPATGGAGRHWQLRRSVRDRKVKGVAGGVAAAADLDPTLVRILFAVAALSGWGIVAYLVLAIVLQNETVDAPAGPLPRDQRRMLRIGLGVAAVIAAGRLFGGWFFSGGDAGLPFLLIAAGGAVLWARRDQSQPAPLSGPQPQAAAGWPDPTGQDLPPPAWPVPPAAPLGAGVDWRSTGHDLLRLAAAFVAVGAFLALLAGTFVVVVGAVPMRLPFLPAAVGATGLLALLAAVVRRARPAGLLIPGGVLVVAVALAIGLTSFPDGTGTRVVVVGPRTPLLERYEHSAGRLVLDLGGLRIEPEGERRVVAKVGTGQLTVIVPPALATDVKARVGAGGITLFGRTEGGPGAEVTGSHGGAPGAGRLDLDLRVGLGEIRVELASEPTFEATCAVPADAKGDGSDPVTCPHPAPLAGQAMSCSVMLVDPEGGSRAGHAFCRRQGSPPAVVGHFAVACEVPGDSEAAKCSPLPSIRLADLADFRAGTLQVGPAVPAAPASPAPPAAPATVPPTTAGPAGAGAPLTCGEPDSAGFRTCTTATSTAPAPTTTAAPTSYRCREDPATGQLTCVPGR